MNSREWEKHTDDLIHLGFLAKRPSRYPEAQARAWIEQLRKYGVLDAPNIFPQKEKEESLSSPKPAIEIPPVNEGLHSTADELVREKDSSSAVLIAVIPQKPADNS